jgi:hypothetical protein
MLPQTLTGMIAPLIIYGSSFLPPKICEVKRVETKQETKVVLQLNKESASILEAKETEPVKIVAGMSNTDLAKPKPVIAKTYPKTIPTISYASYGYKVIGYSDAQCVTWLRQVTGDTRIQGWAGNIRPNSYTPVIGAKAVFTYGHVGLVVGITPNSIIIQEANYIPHLIIERVVNPVEIKGYLI